MPLSRKLNTVPETIGAGQIVVEETAGDGTLIIPAQVYSICVVAVGPGGAASSGVSGLAGGGGALAWKNHIAVYPGQEVPYTWTGKTELVFPQLTVTARAGSGGAGGGTGGAPDNDYDGVEAVVMGRANITAVARAVIAVTAVELSMD